MSCRWPWMALLFGLGVSLFGCGGDSPTSASASTASLGCSDGTLDSNTTHIDLEFGGTTRSYEIHLPPSYDGTRPLPLVLNFHGFTSSGLDQSWNAGLCCGRSATLDVDDVGFTRAIIDDISSRACVDPSRVYATGMSNGGFFSHRLACEAADVIAAVAPVAGVLGIDEEACNPARPIPIIHLHGTGDMRELRSVPGRCERHRLYHRGCRPLLARPTVPQRPR